MIYTYNFHLIAPFLLIFTAGCATTQGPANGNDISKNFYTWGLQANFATDYKVGRHSSTKLGQAKNFLFEASGPDGRLIRASLNEVSDENQASHLLAEELAKLRSIYEFHRDPYFAIISKSTSCPDQYQLSEEKFEGGRFLLQAFANSRETLGACTESTAQHKALLLLLSCGKNFIKIESFIPKQNFNSSDVESIRSIQCVR